MPYSVKGFFEINEEMIQILLMLEVLFTQDSKVEDLFCGASFGSELSYITAYQLGANFSLRVDIKKGFRHQQKETRSHKNDFLLLKKYLPYNL